MFFELYKHFGTEFNLLAARFDTYPSYIADTDEVYMYHHIAYYELRIVGTYIMVGVDEEGELFTFINQKLKFHKNMEKLERYLIKNIKKEGEE